MGGGLLVYSSSGTIFFVFFIYVPVFVLSMNRNSLGSSSKGVVDSVTRLGKFFAIWARL